MQGVLAGGNVTAVQGNLIQNIGAAPQQLSPRHQLPPPPAVFTGRDEELGDLLAKLDGDDASGAAISATPAHGLQGMGGVGKTALAVVLAHRLAARYPGAQLYRDLHGADPEHRQPLTPAEVMRDFILALHPEAEQLPEELDQLGRIYRSVLTDAGRVLLLLDNAANTAQVRPLRPPPGCLLLVTSRQHLTLPGLVVRDLDCLAPDKAAALLLQLAPRVAAHAPEAARLCGGLPLALEVFAGAINDQSLTPVPELLTRLQAGEEKLAPVDAAFTVSESLLPEETRAAWHLLSVFTAGFDLPAAAAVWEKEPAAARAVMQALVNASLVEFNADNARFRLHDLARLFCDRRLTEAQREEACLRHARHYIAVGEEADRLYLQGGEHVVAGLQLFDRERSHLEAAFTRLQTRADPPSAKLLVSLVDAVVYVADLRFHPRQRLAVLEAQNVSSRLAGDRVTEGNALNNIGHTHALLGDARRAIEFHEQALVVLRELGQRRGEGHVLGGLGNAYADLGDVRKAIEFYEHRLVIVRETDDRRGEGNTLGDLGLAYADLGDAAKAIEFQEQRLAIAREIGDRRGEGNALGDLGVAYGVAGDARKAVEFYEQQLVIVREIGDRRGEGNASFNMATILWKAGERARALELMEAASRIYTAIEDPGAERAGAILQEWRGEMGGGA
jgi:tetratricopeptide (TPR) repeat protein